MGRDTCQSLAAVFGRLCLSAIFLFSGFGKIASWSETASHMTEQGMVAVPLFLAGAIALEILGGLSLLLGFHGRLGAFALIVFLIPTTLIFHDFWAFAGAQQQQQMIHFMKNMAIMGGLFVVAGVGTGGCSLDRWIGQGRIAGCERRDDPAMVG